MKTIILCGGLGTRLREETEFKPKPMVKIGPRPILWHIMKSYACQGFADFVLALGYKGETIKNYFCHYELMNNDVTIELGKPDKLCVHQRHGEAGWRITLADTGEKSLKGARLKLVEHYIDSDLFFVTYGDGLADIDLKALLTFHKAHGKIATLTGVSPASQFGQLQVSGDRVHTFHEKPRLGDGIINGGFFVFDRRLFDHLGSEWDCDLEYGVLERLAGQGELMVYRHGGFWACMDTLRDVEYLNRLWDSGQAAWKIW